MSDVLDQLATQRFEQIIEQAGHFAGHQREVDVETLVLVFSLAVGLFLENI